MMLQNKLEAISEQLFEIDKKMQLVLKGQHNDRVSIIQGAQDTIQQAILVKDQRIKENLLTNSISELNKGRRQLINETQEYFIEFGNIPRSEFIKMVKGLFLSLDFEKMSNQAIIVQKNMQIILEATYYQIMAYDIIKNLNKFGKGVKKAGAFISLAIILVMGRQNTFHNR